MPMHHVNYLFFLIVNYERLLKITAPKERSFFQAVVVLILLYGCTTWTLTKRLKKKLDGNYTRMLWAILNKSWRQHPTRHQLYGHLSLIMKTIQVRWTKHTRHCWRSKDELISDILLWTPAYGQAKAGQPAQTYIQQLCEDMGCDPEYLPEAMNDREKWRERVRDIRASSMTWCYKGKITCLLPGKGENKTDLFNKTGEQYKEDNHLSCWTWCQP